MQPIFSLAYDYLALSKKGVSDFLERYTFNLMIKNQIL